MSIQSSVMPGAHVEPMGRIGSVDVGITDSSRPWELELDCLVVSAGRGGFGTLGRAVRAELSGLDLAAMDDLAQRITPGEPATMPIEPAFESMASSTATPQLLMLATVRDDPPKSSTEGPATIEAATLATATCVRTAIGSSIGRLGLPLLGAGAAGLPIDDVVPRIVSVLRQSLATGSTGELREIVLLAPDPRLADAVRTAWNAQDSGVQLSMLADLPIGDPRSDLLGTSGYAEALAFVVDNKKTSTPLTLAINAPWGAGKTSVAKLLERRLTTYLLRSRPPIVCWFNAWHHDDASNIAGALAAKVARAADAERTSWRRLRDPLPTRLLAPEGRRRRYAIRSLLSLAAAAITLAVTSGAFQDLTRGKLGFSVIVGAVTAVLSQAASLRGTAADVGSLARAPDAALLTGSLDEVRADLGRLIHQATVRRRDRRPGRPHRRMIVFIDDLERCQPQRSIEVCETVSSLLSHEDVVVVLIGDMQTLATAAESKYKDLAPRYRTGIISPATADTAMGSFGELYLEKIIQFRFDLPTHNVSALDALAHQLDTDPAEPGDGGPPRPARTHRFTRRLRDWRLHRWLADRDGPTISPVGRAEDAPADPQDDVQIIELQALLERVEGPNLQQSYAAVAECVRPLPRDLKRLLNRIRFYLYVLEKKQLLAPSGPVGPEAVGKWALLAERWPDLAVAVSATPDLLADLETRSRTIDGFIAAMSDRVPGYAHSGELQRLLVTGPPLGALACELSRLTPRQARQ